ncbi:uncharacterized protein LOC129752950 [Uranotaenia lowii]|uniref:uncharacterized protein LOC129752950 n=1 Tax=Uranotaenia lowii TaxID=190385 RepID=UPI00247A0377|nr:uncharacterized protein LOC129752950 [Uranotaenia lowii]
MCKKNSFSCYPRRHSRHPGGLCRSAPAGPSSFNQPTTWSGGGCSRNFRAAATRIKASRTCAKYTSCCGVPSSSRRFSPLVTDFGFSEADPPVLVQRDERPCSIIPRFKRILCILVFMLLIRKRPIRRLDLRLNPIFTEGVIFVLALIYQAHMALRFNKDLRLMDFSSNKLDNA